MVTLEDVAVLAGVSRATVSRVVNGDTNVKAQTREKVEQAVAVLGYTPNPAARALASSQSNTLGLVTTSYRGGFFGALMDFVQTEAESQGKQLLVTQGRDNADKEWQAIQRLYNLRCDGLILHVRFLSDERLHQLAAAGRSFVLLDRLVPGPEARCVTFDHRRASQMATQVLIDAGHRHIACISGSAQRHSSELRRQGFIDAMQLAGLEPVACVEGVYDRKAAINVQMRSSSAHSTPPLSIVVTKKWLLVPCWLSISITCKSHRIFHCFAMTVANVLHLSARH